MQNKRLYLSRINFNLHTFLDKFAYIFLGKFQLVHVLYFIFFMATDAIKTFVASISCINYFQVRRNNDKRYRLRSKPFANGVLRRFINLIITVSAYISFSVLSLSTGIPPEITLYISYAMAS